jgi:hypothetical protein
LKLYAGTASIEAILQKTGHLWKPMKKVFPMIKEIMSDFGETEVKQGIAKKGGEAWIPFQGTG